MRTLSVKNQISINASPETVWEIFVDLDITAFDHPWYFQLLGIPKPLRAEVISTGLGGLRTAHFANERRFSQKIFEWEPYKLFSFSFEADPGFRVGHVLDIGNGPFQMKSGSYRIEPGGDQVNLTLSSIYQLRGARGTLLAMPVRMVLIVFQKYLLKGIKLNAEGVTKHRD